MHRPDVVREDGECAEGSLSERSAAGSRSSVVCGLVVRDRTRLLAVGLSAFTTPQPLTYDAGRAGFCGRRAATQPLRRRDTSRTRGTAAGVFLRRSYGAGRRSAAQPRLASCAEVVRRGRARCCPRLLVALTAAGARLAGLRNPCHANASGGRPFASDGRAPKEYPRRPRRPTQRTCAQRASCGWGARSVSACE